MPTMLVTLEGPQRTLDLEVPGEAPISDLLPLLTELFGLQTIAPGPYGAPTWALARREAEVTPLSPARSLLDYGVVDGMRLLLFDLVAWRRERERAAASAPRPLAPSTSTGGIGVRWNPEGLLPTQ